MWFLEMIFEIIVDGSIELSENKKVPMPVRVLATLVCIAFAGVVLALIYIEGYDALDAGNTATGITLWVVGCLVAMILVYFVFKQYKEIKQRREHKEDKRSGDII